MALQKKITLGLWPHIISFVTSFLVGIDIFFFFFLYVYTSLGLVPALFIAGNGLVLNAYLYYIDGPNSLIDYWLSKNARDWRYIFDIIAFLGGLLIFIFTFYVYAQWVMLYPFMSIWTTPFLVLVMAFSDGVGTYTMNKSGFIELLQHHHTQSTLVDTLKTWWQQFSVHFSDMVFKYEKKWSTAVVLRAIRLFVFPILLATLVVFSFTRTYLIGSLIIAQGTIFSIVLVPLIWISAIAFFIGDLYFNCEQNLNLMHAYENSTQLVPKNIFSFLIMLVIAANAIANGFVAMESSLFTLTAWGLLRFGGSLLQYFAVFSNKCLKFTGWHELNARHAPHILKVSFTIIFVLIILYLLQITLAEIALPFAIPMQLFMLPFACLILYQFAHLSYDTFVPRYIHNAEPSLHSCFLNKNPSDINSQRINDKPIEDDKEVKKGQIASVSI